MLILCCFTSSSMGDKKKYKVEKDESSNTMKTLQVRLEQPLKSEDMKSTPFSVPVPFSIPRNTRCTVKVMSHESNQVEEVPNEGEDEDDNESNQSMKRDYSNSDFQENDQKSVNINSSDTEINDHASDPGTGKVAFWGSPKLKRSCSNLETRNVLNKIALNPSKPGSFEELHKLEREEIDIGSPISVMTHCSADKVILKKHSSCQILPSKSRRLWWKLFLWSHRNQGKREIVMNNKLAIINQEGGYCSDSQEPNRGNMKNQWVAFSTESRVDEWVKEISIEPQLLVENEENGIFFPPSPARSTSHRLGRNMNVSEEIAHANSVIQSLNSSSSVAHISSIGLKVIPAISRFSSLRSVNLSGNSIVHITPGSLPKGLHTLDLSRNKINTIEGLRDLTRLRILHLSYNRISRIAQGLSNCTLIKELYLAGNKISNIEGLHRLMKLAILDLSFNKITTSKALGQLVANYNSLQALNLLGNPIQSNISDDQLRKALSGLLPKLAYVNKQPVNPQKAREVATEAIAKAALANSGRRKAVKRVSHGGTSSSSRHRSNVSVAHKSRHGAKSGTHHHSYVKTNKSSALASSKD